MSTLAEALAPRSDQLNADDLIPGPRTITITDAKITKTERQTRIKLNFEGDSGKPYYPCKTMGRAMVMVWAVTDEKQMVGKSITVYRDPEVKFGDQGAVGGIRISHMSHIDSPKTVKLTVSQGKKGNFVFNPLVASADRVVEGVRTLIERINEIDPANIASITDDPAVIKQRGWLDKNRPDLAAQIASALAAKLDTDEDDPFSGPTDTDRGELFNGDTDQPLAVKTAGEIKALFQSAPDKPAYMEALAQFNKHKTGIEAHDQALAADVFTAEQVAKQRLGV